MSAVKKHSERFELIKSEFQLEEVREKTLLLTEELKELEKLKNKALNEIKIIALEKDNALEEVAGVEEKLLNILEEKLSFKKESNSSIEKLEKNRHQLRKLEEEINAKEETLARLEKECDESRALSSTFIDNVSVLQKQEDALNLKIAEIKESDYQYRLHRAKLLAQLKENSQYHQDIKTENKILEDSIEKLTKQIKYKKEILHKFNVNEELISNQDKTHRELEGKIAVSENLNKQLLVQVDEKEKRLQLIHSEIQIKQDALNKEKSTLLKIEKRIQENKTIDKELIKARNEFDNLKQKYNLLETDYKSLKSKYDKVLERSKDSEKELKRTEKSIRVKEGELEKITEEFELLKESMAIVEEDHLQSLAEGQRELDGLTLEIKNEQSVLQQIKSEIQQASEESLKLDDRKGRLIQESTDLQKEIISSENKKMEVESELQNLKMSIEKNEDQIKEKKVELKELKKEVKKFEARQKDFRSLDKKCLDLEIKVNRLTEQEKLLLKAHEEKKLELAECEVDQKRKAEAQIDQMLTDAQNKKEELLENAKRESDELLEQSKLKIQKLEEEKKYSLAKAEEASVRKLEVELEKMKSDFLRNENLDKSIQSLKNGETLENKTLIDSLIMTMFKYYQQWKQNSRNAKLFYTTVLSCVVIAGTFPLTKGLFESLYQRFSESSMDKQYVEDIQQKRVAMYVKFEQSIELHDDLLSNLLYTKSFADKVLSPEFQNNYIVNLNDFVLLEQNLHEDNVFKIVELENNFFKEVMAIKERVPKEEKEKFLQELRIKEKQLNDQLYKIFLTQNALKDYFRFRKSFYLDHIIQK